MKPAFGGNGILPIEVLVRDVAQACGGESGHDVLVSLKVYLAMFDRL
jgi:hypothetical protein